MRALLLTLTTCLFVLPAQAKYSGGTGEPNDPYQIATAADLIALGETPGDYDKHFLLTADIDLDPNLPGRKVFDKAVIAPDTDPNDHWSMFQGTPFTGLFDGNGHRISHLTIVGKGYVGLFGQLGHGDASGGEVENLGVVDVNITGSGDCVGGLVGENRGVVSQCYSTGAVCGIEPDVGGLMGVNLGDVSQCYSTGTVDGKDRVGGLVGENWQSVTRCYSTCTVSGAKDSVGGLAGWNGGIVTQCYSTSGVSGNSYVGGLVGENLDGVSQCYSTGTVDGNDCVGGLVGYDGAAYNGAAVEACFWDIQTSGQTRSDAGTGLTTAQMQIIETYLNAGWDFVGETANGTHEVWQTPEGGGYPVLAILSGYAPPLLQGFGTPENPYLISDTCELGAMLYCGPYTHYRLARSIDLRGIRWSMPVMPWFAGSFDGNDLTISHLTIGGASDLGLFGRLESGAEVKNLGMVDVNIAGSGESVGGLTGHNAGVVTLCYSTGTVNGNKRDVGGLMGSNLGTVTNCYSSAVVRSPGTWGVGGLVGHNPEGGHISGCRSSGEASGVAYVGGLAGSNGGIVTNCYSEAEVSGGEYVGGLAGYNGGIVTQCYSTGAVSGIVMVGGLAGYEGEARWGDAVTACFWDTQTSGQATSHGGTGKTTAEMKKAKTFLDAGWDFVGEAANGTEDIWRIDEGKNYPKLSWELEEGFVHLFPREGIPQGWVVRAWDDVNRPADPSVKWGVKDGILYGAEPRGTWLLSEKQYGDFIVMFEFRLGPTGNSGCALRAPLFGDPTFEGMELQMVDYRYNTQAKDSELTGAISRAIAPRKQVYKPTEWNSCAVTLEGSHLMVVLNGETVHDLNLDEQEQQVKRYNGTLAPPVKDRPRKGHIGFQEMSRGTEHVQVRSARIKVLDKPEGTKAKP